MMTLVCHINIFNYAFELARNSGDSGVRRRARRLGTGRKICRTNPKYCGEVVFGRFGGVINLRLSLSARGARYKTIQGVRRRRECVPIYTIEGVRGCVHRAGKKQCYTRRILTLTV